MTHEQLNAAAVVLGVILALVIVMFFGQRTKPPTPEEWRDDQW